MANKIAGGSHVASIRDVHDGEVWSSILLADGACGAQKLFTTPQGQPCPRMPPDAAPRMFPYNTELLTNLYKTTELGAHHGDAAFNRLSIDFIGGSVDDIAEVCTKTHLSLRIAGKIAFAAILTALPRVFDVPIMCAYSDCLECGILISTSEPLTLAKPLVLRITLKGKFARDIR